MNFVRVNGTRFVLGAEDSTESFYFLGANLWNGMSLGAAGPSGNRTRLALDLDALAGAGITQLRILGASEGPDSEPWRIVPSLQPCPGVYNPDVLDGFDYIICDSPAGIEKGAFLAMYFADRAVVVVNPEVSSVRDSDRIIGLLDSKTHKAESGQDVPAFLLLTRYTPLRVESGEMLSIADVEEVLGLKAIGVIPESGDVLNASNKGEPVILDVESAAGQAYDDAVARILGEERPMRFTNVEKKGFFSKLFGG